MIVMLVCLSCGSERHRGGHKMCPFFGYQFRPTRNWDSKLAELAYYPLAKGPAGLLLPLSKKLRMRLLARFSKLPTKGASPKSVLPDEMLNNLNTMTEGDIVAWGKALGCIGRDLDKTKRNLIRRLRKGSATLDVWSGEVTQSHPMRCDAFPPHKDKNDKSNLRHSLSHTKDIPILDCFEWFGKPCPMPECTGTIVEHNMTL